MTLQPRSVDPEEDVSEWRKNEKRLWTDEAEEIRKMGERAWPSI